MDDNGDENKSPVRIKEEPADECEDNNNNNKSPSVSDVPTIVLNDCNPDKTLRKRKSLSPSLIVSNFPEHFTYPQIKKYLEGLCDPCEIRTLKDVDSRRVIKATFKSVEEKQHAQKVLHLQRIDDAYISVTSSDTEDNMEVQKQRSQAKSGPKSSSKHRSTSRSMLQLQKKREESEREGVPWGLDMDVWQDDPKGLYGIKPQYLASLGISGPLFNGVSVSNYEGDRNQMLELFELAGEVLSCTIIDNKPSRYACIMYKHPLEALQAVTMFDGQTYNGKCLSVKMKPFCKDELPGGLAGVGPGFDKNGSPLRDIVRHYLRYINGQSSELNYNIFRTPLEQCNDADAPMLDNDNNANNDNKTKAKASIEGLVAEGVDIKDLVQALKEVIAAQKYDSEDPLIQEFMNTDEKCYDFTPSKKRKQTERKNGALIKNKDQSTLNLSIEKPDNSSKSVNSVKSPSTSPDFIVEDDPQTSKDSVPKVLKPKSVPKRVQSSSPQPIKKRTPWQNSSGSYRGQSSGPSRPVGPRGMGSAPFTSNPLRSPFGNQISGPNIGPMAGPSNLTRLGPMFIQMPGPRPGPMSGPMQRPPSGPMQNLSGPMSNFNGPMQNQGGPMSNIRGPMSGPPGSMNMQMGDNFAMRGPNAHPPTGSYSSGCEAKLVFNNLPLSVTFALLSDRLSQAGPVESIQFKQPGCVEVTYSHRVHALNSKRIFDKSRLDGNEIHVEFL